MFARAGATMRSRAGAPPDTPPAQRPAGCDHLAARSSPDHLTASSSGSAGGHALPVGAAVLLLEAGAAADEALPVGGVCPFPVVPQVGAAQQRLGCHGDDLLSRRAA